MKKPLLWMTHGVLPLVGAVSGGVYGFLASYSLPWSIVIGFAIGIFFSACWVAVLVIQGDQDR